MPKLPETDAASEDAPCLTDSVVAESLRRNGFAFVAGPAMRALSARAGANGWDDYAASWDDLGPDRFMADGGTYRKRRFACFSVAGDDMRAKPPQAHFQAVAFNPLNGGVSRTFEAVHERIAFHPVNRALVTTCRTIFEAASGGVTPAPVWHVEMHQFRIEARPDAAGQPTPEGLHRDGVDWVMVLMVRRENVEGGDSTIADADRRPFHRATLADPLDACFVDDRRVLHGVSPIHPLDPSRPSCRDALVLTFRAERP